MSTNQITLSDVDTEQRTQVIQRDLRTLGRHD